MGGRPRRDVVTIVVRALDPATDRTVTYLKWHGRLANIASFKRKLDRVGQVRAGRRR